MYKRILFPLDNQAFALAVLPHAQNLAKFIKTKLNRFTNNRAESK